nr:MAG: hypothetical protein EDM05_25125 [Leptolyngbya sp. IPPAS B-1204]
MIINKFMQITLIQFINQFTNRIESDRNDKSFRSKIELQLVRNQLTSSQLHSQTRREKFSNLSTLHLQSAIAKKLLPIRAYE